MDKNNLNSYRGVWVVAELDTQTGNPRKVTYELLGEARRVADALCEELSVVLFCKTLAEETRRELEETGCNRALLLPEKLLADCTSETIAAVLADLIEARKPSVVLIPGTELGRDFAPRVSAKLRVGLTADCTALEVNEDRELVQIRPTYGGNLMAYITTPEHRPQMATIRPNIFTVKKCKTQRELAIEYVDIAVKALGNNTRCVAFEPRSSPLRDLSEAEIVLVAGYGLGKEHMPMLYRLAQQFDAAVGVTRKVVDEGWAPFEQQIGQTGKSIAPDLCILFGVSGALQHTIGIRNAKKIIAVNHDPTAPVFQISSAAVLADAAEVLEQMMEQIEEVRKRRELLWH